MADNDAPEADEAAANDAQAAAGGSDAPVEEAPGPSEGGGGQGGELDIEAAESRLEEVGEEIEKGRRALADMEDEVDPKPDGPPIAEGEGAAIAPPG